MRYPIASAIYCTCMGALMIAMWVFFITTGEIPELESRPAEIVLHLVAEFATAACLITAGVLTMSKRSLGLLFLPLALGMLLYTLIVSPGYYLQSGETGFVVMFAVVLTLAVVFLVLALRSALRLIGR